MGARVSAAHEQRAALNPSATRARADGRADKSAGAGDENAISGMFGAWFHGKSAAPSLGERRGQGLVLTLEMKIRSLVCSAKAQLPRLTGA